MPKIVTFGEIMLRLAPPGYLRFIQSDCLEATFGGGEANVAISLANFCESVSFVTKLPQNDIGQSAINSLRRYGVDTSYIVRGGDRIGIYFLEKGASQRPSKIIYDRANSSISMADMKDFDWGKIFEGAEWFHFTGITPALKGNLPAICEQACIEAKKRAITISCDLNFRKKLWTNEEANRTMTRLVRYVDVCLANEEDAKDVFGIEAKMTNVTAGELSREGYEHVAKTLHDRYDFQIVAITLRSSISANDNLWSAMLYNGSDFYFSKSYNMHIVDRVGGGDSFAAGLIYSLIRKKPSKDALEFAVAASCLKHSVEGDYNHVSTDEVERIITGDASGRVQR